MPTKRIDLAEVELLLSSGETLAATAARLGVVETSIMRSIYRAREAGKLTEELARRAFAQRAETAQDRYRAGMARRRRRYGL